MTRPAPSHRTLRRALGLALRLAIAAAGLALVAAQLTWRDAVALPAGYVIRPGLSVEQSADVPVLQRHNRTLTVSLPDGRTAELSADRLTADPTGPRFKPGLLSTLDESQPALLAMAMLLSFLIYPLQATRWWTLMRARGLPAPKAATFRIFMAGLFYNSFMPGMTGGDLFKAYYIARHSDQRADAILTIVVDRLSGLVGLVILACGAAAVALAMGRTDPTTRTAARAVAVVAAGLAVAATVYFIPALQRLLGVGLLDRLLPDTGPIAAARRAVAAYRHHRPALAVAVVLSIVSHATIIAVALLSSRAVGMETAAWKFAALMPLVIMAGSLPLSFMGLGLIEPTGVALLGEAGVATANQIVTMLVLIRVYQVAWSALGAGFIIRGGLTLPARSNEARSSR